MHFDPEIEPRLDRVPRRAGQLLARDETYLRRQRLGACNQAAHNIALPAQHIVRRQHELFVARFDPRQPIVEQRFKAPGAEFTWIDILVALDLARPLELVPLRRKERRAIVHRLGAALEATDEFVGILLGAAGGELRMPRHLVVEPKGAGKRRGIELVGFWRPVEWLALDAVYTASHARLDSPDDDNGFIGNYIEGSVEEAGEIGFSLIKGPWEISSRLRYLGAYPLLPDNSERAKAEQVINLRAAWKASHVTLYGELLNVLGDQGKDITYYYPTNVTGFDPPGVEINGRVSRPCEPRTLRAGIKYEF